MRNLEKGLLLAELIDPSLTSKEQIEGLVDWIRKQDSYLQLVKNMMEIKKSSAFLATILYEEFSSIDLDRVKSIEEGLIAYSKILYLCQIAIPNFYVNPLLVLTEKEKHIPLGEVLVKFNEKYVTLDEISMDNSFSFNEKYDFINKKVNEWEDEVYNKIIDPIKELNRSNRRNLPKINIIPLSYILIGITFITEILMLVFLFLFGSDNIKSLLFNLNTSSYLDVNYLLLVFLSLLSLSTIVFLISILIRIIKYHKYCKARKIIINNEGDISKFVNEAGDKLTLYIIKNMEKQELMKKKVYTFSSCYFIFEYVSYLYYINFKCKKIKDNKMRLVHIVLFALTEIFFIAFLVMLIIRVN